MTILIILSVIAAMVLLFGFFEIRIPFIAGRMSHDSTISDSSSAKKAEKESGKNLEAFYRTIRVEKWMNNIQSRTATEAV